MENLTPGRKSERKITRKQNAYRVLIVDIKNNANQGRQSCEVSQIINDCQLEVFRNPIKLKFSELVIIDDLKSDQQAKLIHLKGMSVLCRTAIMCRSTLSSTT